MTPLRLSFLLLCCALAACANHIRFVDTEQDEEKRSTLAVRYGVEGPAEVLEVAKPRLTFFKSETVETRTERTVTRVEEKTPYLGSREFYEVPGGLFSIPLSFVFNALDCVLLGYIPNEPVYGYTAWTFSALNPFLNTEDANRKQVFPIHKESREFKRSEALVRSPLAQAAVALSLDGHQVSARTDAEGVLQVNLLQLMDPRGPASAPRRLTVALRGAKGSDELQKSFFVDRALGLGMQRALPLVRMAGDPSAEPVALARAIYALDRLGFREESAVLHEAAHERLASRPDALAALSRGIDALYTSVPPVEELLLSLARDVPDPAPPASPVRR
jgi:hypothetical protein